MKSIVSYPERGPWGSSRWRGNCSGYLIRDLLMYYRPDSVLDPMCGSNTCGDVCREMGIEYTGLDLHSGFNIIRDRLSDVVQGSPSYCWVHPPYHSAIAYSGNVWGRVPHPDDLSHCSSYGEFIEKLVLAMYNVFDVLCRGAHYSVLIGDVRKDGEFYSIQADLIKSLPGKLESVVIKEQHNVMSDSIKYKGTFIPIAHEYCLQFTKDRVVFGVLDAAVNSSLSLVHLSNASWKAIVEWTLMKLGGKASLQEIYAAVAENAHAKIVAKDHWKAKIRQTLQRCASGVERGVWALREAA